MDWKLRLQRIGTIGIATGGFSGYFPIAPGTMGSLVGAAIVWGIRDTSVVIQVILSVALLLIGVWASDKARQIFGQSDPSRVVIDEIVGMMITMIGIPVTPYWLFWGFLIFRILDIVKIPPASYFDTRVKSGWGVMMDDVWAGIYGNILLHLMLRAMI
jgi:phosphatidylglycerophosphatase A